ncbi:MAG: type II secretion system protein GspL [Pseudomonadota bacterium]
MPETLVIRMPEDLSAPARWTVIDEAGTRIGSVGEGALTEAANSAMARDVLVLVPGTQVITTRARLPVKSVSKMLQVIPFALEEQMAGDVMRMHFAVGHRSSEGDVDVMAVRKDRMAGWVDALDEAGLSAARIAPESIGMPATEQGYTVLLHEHESAVRDPDGTTCYVDHDSLVDALELMTEPGEDDDEVAAKPPVVVYFEDTESHGDLLESVKARIDQAEFRRLPAGALARVAAEALERKPATLRQGDFAPRGRIDKLWAPWRTAASLAAVLLFATVAVKAAELVTYKKRFGELRAEMSSLYQSKVPGANANEIDPYGDLRRRLNGGSTDSVTSDFLDGLSVLAGSLKGDKTYLEAINFTNGTMSLEVIAPDVPTLDTLRSSIAGTQGWDANLTQTRDKDQQVEGRLQIRRANP